MHLEDEYPGQLREMMRIIRHDPDRAKAKWPSPERLADDLRPDSAHNHDIFDLVDSPAGGYLRIRSSKLVSALSAKRQRLDKAARIETVKTERAAREQAAKAERDARDQAIKAERDARDQAIKAERDARDQAIKAERDARDQAAKAERDAQIEAKQRAQQARQEDLFAAWQAELGGVPTTEREFVALKTEKDAIRMSFDRQFTRKGEARTAEQILLDLHLTAADLAMVKPRGDHLSATNIDRAFHEWSIAQAQACIERVTARIMTMPDGDVQPEGVIMAFERTCGWYFKEPIFAARAIQKMIWQIKRALLNLPIEQRHMLVFLGEQNCGKTYVQRMITAVIHELVAEASLKDVLDERQMALPLFLVIMLDELVAADRADAAALKNFITGQDWARRPMRSNVVEKIKLRASLFGTTNHSLGKLIFDSTGMRRFIELAVLSRKEIEPHWQDIIGFDWLQLWQAVDPYAIDPLMSEFGDVLITKQEELRNAENTETWLRQYEPVRTNARSWTADTSEWFAQDLYHEFRQFEQDFDRAYRGTSLTRWGRDMKSLIDTGRFAEWSHFKYGSKTVYRVKRTEPDPLANKITQLFRK